MQVKQGDMKNKKTQFEFIKNKLLKDGSISRNYCLQNYLTRLSARIADLNADGWVIKGSYHKTDKGKDYIYTAIKTPYKKEVLRVPVTGKEFTRYVRCG